MKILIFTADFGNGHKRVAQALKTHHHKDEVFLVNPHKDTSKIINVVGVNFYNILMKYSHKKVVKIIYSKAFNFFSSPNGSIFNKFGTEHISKQINNIQPNIIYFTFPYQPQKLNITSDNVITVITDYGFSPNWYNKNSNTYIVGDDKSEMKLKEINKDVKILNIGIPIVGKGYIREQKKPQNLMINLGAKGNIQYKRLKKILDEISQYNINVVVICGKNKKLKNKIEKKLKKDNITLLGFVNNIEEYYIKTDIMYTKAGGLSITEAINYEIPLIVDSFISMGGQEEINIDFVKNKNIGIILNEKNGFSSINEIVNDSYIDKLNNIKAIKNKYEENKKLNIKGI